MKLIIAAAMLAFAAPASAQKDVHVTVDGDSVVKVVDRVEIGKSTFHILNIKQETALIVRDSTLVMQLTDRGLANIKREIKKEGESALGKMMHAALAGAMEEFLDHGMEYQLSDLKEARIEKGVLVLERKNGDLIFDEMEINGEEVLETFAPLDAARFAAHVNRLIR
jgi:hypothetical protein